MKISNHFKFNSLKIVMGIVLKVYPHSLQYIDFHNGGEGDLSPELKRLLGVSGPNLFLHTN